jgi:Ca2+-binding EF-hand superfamily protein
MGHQIFPKEVQSIVRRLDIDGDNKITFSEFYEALQLISRQNPDSN